MRYATAIGSRFLALDGDRVASFACGLVIDTQAGNAEPMTLVPGGVSGSAPPTVKTIAWTSGFEEAERIAAALNAAENDGDHIDRCVARLESMHDQLAKTLAELRRALPRRAP